jgi:hypothetical protein
MSRNPSKLGGLARNIFVSNCLKFSLANMAVMDAEPNNFAKLFVLDKIRACAYGPANPPKDWADISPLIPHKPY